MKRTKPTTLQLGTISEGTLRPSDLFESFMDACNSIQLTKAERKETRDIYAESLAGGDDYWESEACSDAVNALQTILESHCPDYSYFGTLEGDGACFGVWASIDQLEENAVAHTRFLDPNDPRMSHATVCKVNAGSPFPSASIGVVEHVMEVSDHGNVTLYRRAGNRWIEVWSVV